MVPMAPVVAAINHLLAQEPWARQALARHAGKVALVDADSVVLRIAITSDGHVAAADVGRVADVTIRVKPADLPLIVQNRERAFSYVKIEGDAEFANAISQVSKRLRWEAEHDLEPWIGPIAATRVVGGARALADTVIATNRKLAENVAEYLLEEDPMLVRPAAVADFGADVNKLRDDVERLAKRIAKLEQKA